MLPLITLGPSSPFKGHQHSNSQNSFKKQSIEKFRQTNTQISTCKDSGNDEDPKTPVNKKTTTVKKKGKIF